MSLVEGLQCITLSLKSALTAVGGTAAGAAGAGAAAAVGGRRRHSSNNARHLIGQTLYERDSSKNNCTFFGNAPCHIKKRTEVKKNVS